MSNNPYAEDLGTNDPVNVIQSTPEKLEALLGKLSSEQMEHRTAPGKWNLREIMAHLADCEIAFGFRLRQAAAGVDIQPFNQDDWARNYGAYSFAAAIATYRAVRAWNLALIRSLTDEQKRFEVSHPERGTMSVWTIVEMMAGHDLHHLKALEK
jgi:uncharacterized damage-inducible protein DinB